MRPPPALSASGSFRRHRILIPAIAAFGLPFSVEAQQAPRVARIGLLTPSSPTGSGHLVEAFRQGMRELGHVEGKTFVLEARYGDGKSERLPELAGELVRLKADVVVTSTDAATAAVRRNTRTTPIVMAFGTDPVGTGFVTSLARPGGNVTGLSNVTAELGGKRLELLKEAVPGLSRVAFLWNPDVRGALLDFKETEARAHSLRLELVSLEVSTDDDLERAFATLPGEHVQAFIVAAANIVMFARRPAIARFAQSNRLASLYAAQEYVEVGGLMSYGVSVSDMFRRSAVYVDKILKGAKPGDLPVEQPTKFELAINLKTAKAIGLTIPSSLLLRADRVFK